MATRYPVQAVKTTAHVMEAVARLDEPTLGNLVNYLDLPKSTVHDHIQTLKAIGYLVDTGEGYRISMRVLDLGERTRKELPVFKHARAELEKLSKQTGKFASLMVEENKKGVLVYTVHGNQTRKVSIQPIHPGTRTHLHTTALGKAILSELPRDRVQEIINDCGLPEMTSNTITDPVKLFKELEAIRDRGVAVDHQEQMDGIYGVAAPLVRRNQGVEGAVSIYTPVSWLEETGDRKELHRLIRQAANVIELNMNYS